MGQGLLKCFQFAEANGGLPVVMRVAMKTGVQSNKAADAPDDPATIAKAKEVIKEAIGKDVPGV